MVSPDIKPAANGGPPQEYGERLDVSGTDHRLAPSGSSREHRGIDLGAADSEPVVDLRHKDSDKSELSTATGKTNTETADHATDAAKAAETEAVCGGVIFNDSEKGEAETGESRPDFGQTVFGDDNVDTTPNRPDAAAGTGGDVPPITTDTPMGGVAEEPEENPQGDEHVPVDDSGSGEQSPPGLQEDVRNFRRDMRSYTSYAAETDPDDPDVQDTVGKLELTDQIMRMYQDLGYDKNDDPELRSFLNIIKRQVFESTEQKKQENDGEEIPDDQP